MADPTSIQLEVALPMTYRVDTLLADVRPLRALCEDLALEVRTTLLSKGSTEPVLEAALDLAYVGEHEPVTVPFPLEIENAAVCLSDPLPLDSQALRQAVAAFHAAQAERAGATDPSAALQMLMVRVRGYGAPGA